MNFSIWHIEEVLTDPITLDQIRPEGNDNEGLIYILDTIRLETHYEMKFNVILAILNGLKQCYIAKIIFGNIILPLHTHWFQILISQLNIIYFFTLKCFQI